MANGKVRDPHAPLSHSIAELTFFGKDGHRCLRSRLIEVRDSLPGNTSRHLQ